MSKHLPSTLLALSLLLAACTPAATPTPVTPPATVAPATATTPPTAPPVSPTVTLPVPTATPEKREGVIQLFHASIPVTLTNLTMQTATTGWGVGQAEADANDHLLRTTDGGQTWADVTPPQPYMPTDEMGLQATAWFADADAAWVVYASRNMPLPSDTPISVWHTANGGQTWQASTPLAVESAESFWPAAFSFVNAKTGWLLVHAGAGMNHDYVMVYTTQDGGANWALVVDPFGDTLPMGCYKNGLHFVDAKNGWITGDCGGVSPEVYFYHTPDGGLTWASVPLPNPSTDPDFFENSACRTQELQTPTPQALRVLMVCMLFDENGTLQSWLYRSDDQGATWNFSPAPMGEGVLAFLSPLEGWFLGNSSGDPAQAQHQLFHTTDGGQTWQAGKALDWTSHLNWLDANTALGIAHAWTATGEDALALVQTTDGGQTWQQVNPIIAP